MSRYSSLARRFRRNERGQALVEFALVVPLLLVMVMAIIDFGRAWNLHQTITDAARTGARQAVIDVIDTGTGVPPEIADHIFDSFLSGRSDGTGLGLDIAKRILLSHHGDIALHATGPAGTTLRVRHAERLDHPVRHGVGQFGARQVERRRRVERHRVALVAEPCRPERHRPGVAE